MITRFLEKNRQQKLRIYCVGDAMVDEYYNGVVNRISPEFPMSIMTSPTDEPVRRPGGVANVAYQLKYFNVDTTLIGISDDLASDTYIMNELRGEMINARHEGGHVPIKRRFLANGIQVFRHDVEEPYYGVGQVGVNKLLDQLFGITKELPTPDAVIFSDYDKGFFVDPSLWMRWFGKTITIVDPKKGPVDKWRGCSVFKPNAKEAQEMSGLTYWKDQCLYFHEKLPGTAIVITKGGEGVVGFDGTFFEYTPKKKIQVESVIGAGDCFVSILSLAIAHGMMVSEAVEVAYRAGEVYVQNRLNRPIVPAELSTSKIVKPEDLVNRDFKLVFTNGCYDILHTGHYATLDFAKSKGDKLVVAINSDESVRRLKGQSRPVNCLEKRLQMVSRLDMVDFVVAFEEDTPLETIQRCCPDVLVKGGDYSGKAIVGQDIVPEVLYAPLVEGESTTAVLGRIKSQ